MMNNLPGRFLRGVRFALALALVWPAGCGNENPAVETTSTIERNSQPTRIETNFNLRPSVPLPRLKSKDDDAPPAHCGHDHPILYENGTSVTGLTEKQRLAVDEIKNHCDRNFEVAWGATGVPEFVHCRIPIAGSLDAVPATFLDLANDLYRMSDPAGELRLKERAPYPDGSIRFTFDQVYKGVPVHAAGLTVHAKGAFITGVTGSYVPEISIPPVPAVGAEEAVRIARGHMAGQAPEGSWTSQGNPNLIVFCPRLFEPTSGDADRLCWQVRIVCGDHLGSWICYVDAHTGGVIQVLSEMCGVRDRRGWRFLAGAPPYRGQQFYAEGMLPPAPDDPRNGYNFCQQYDDAFVWDPPTIYRPYFCIFYTPHAALAPVAAYAAYDQLYDQVYFEEGWVLRDVVAHEFEHQMQLLGEMVRMPMGESGSFFEAMADVVAAYIDNDDWLMGEGSPMGPLRNMASPRQLGDVDHLDNFDRGPNAIYRNAGIINKAAFLISDGGLHGRPGDLIQVEGQGRYTMFAVFAGALYNRRLRGALDFAQARLSLLQEAESRYGRTSPVVCTVKNAFAAVGIGERCRRPAASGSIRAQPNPVEFSSSGPTTATTTVSWEARDWETTLGLQAFRDGVLENTWAVASPGSRSHTVRRGSSYTFNLVHRASTTGAGGTQLATVNVTTRTALAPSRLWANLAQVPVCRHLEHPGTVFLNWSTDLGVPGPVQIRRMDGTVLATSAPGESGTIDVNVTRGSDQRRYHVFGLYTGSVYATSCEVTAVERNFSAFSLSASPTEAVAGDTVELRWVAPSGSCPWDFFALYAVGAVDSVDSVAWQTEGRREGTLSIPLPSRLPTGNYEYRYHPESTTRTVAVSGQISVTNAYTLVAWPDSITTSDSLSVTFTAPGGRPESDWVGLFLVGSPDGPFGDWQYTGGLSQGTLSFAAPASPGRYEFRYFLDEGFTRTARSNPIVVRAPEPLQLTLAQPISPVRQPQEAQSLVFEVNDGYPSAEWTISLVEPMAFNILGNWSGRRFTSTFAWQFDGSLRAGAYVFELRAAERGTARAILNVEAPPPLALELRQPVSPVDLPMPPTRLVFEVNLGTPTSFFWSIWFVGLDSTPYDMPVPGTWNGRVFTSDAAYELPAGSAPGQYKYMLISPLGNAWAVLVVR